MIRYMSLAERRANREQHERELADGLNDRFAGVRSAFAQVPCSSAAPVCHRVVVKLDWHDGTNVHRPTCTCGWRGLPVKRGEHETARAEGLRHVVTHELSDTTVHVSGVDPNRVAPNRGGK